jgi:prepilin-type processing-associated H-X9-DG protein
MRRKPRRAGLSLIELAVLIGTAVVLVSLLLPALQSARQPKSDAERGIHSSQPALDELSRHGDAAPEYNGALPAQGSSGMGRNLAGPDGREIRALGIADAAPSAELTSDAAGGTAPSGEWGESLYDLLTRPRDPQWDADASWEYGAPVFHPGGVNFAFCDSPVHFIKDSIDSWPVDSSAARQPDADLEGPTEILALAARFKTGISHPPRSPDPARAFPDDEY